MKTHYLQIANDALNDAIKGIEYVESQLSSPSLEPWERKEYFGVLDKRLKEKQDALGRIEFINNNF